MNLLFYNSCEDEHFFAISDCVSCRCVCLDDFGIFSGPAKKKLDRVAGRLDSFRDFGCIVEIGGASFGGGFDSARSSPVARFDFGAGCCCRFGIGQQGARSALDSMLRGVLSVRSYCRGAPLFLDRCREPWRGLIGGT